MQPLFSCCNAFFLGIECQSSSGNSSDLVSQLMNMMITEMNTSMGGVLTDDMITVNVTQNEPMQMTTGSISDIVEEVDVTTGSSTLTIGTTQYDVLQCLAPVDCAIIEYAGELNTSYFYDLSNGTEFVTSDFLSCTGKLCLIQRFQELTQMLLEQTLAVSLSPIPVTTTSLALPPLDLTPPTTTTTQQIGCSCEISSEPLCCDGVDYTNKCIAGCVVDDVESMCTEGTCSGEPIESSMDLSSLMQAMMDNAMQNLSQGGRKLMASIAECEDKLDACCPEYEVLEGEDICSIAAKFGSACDLVKLYNKKESVEAGDMIQVC
eukprot:TRINITY_DN2975_c0_g1_i8.p1 TRINITY_DN2975_c0_g1~~TRINITY_DN2975_c0_g1_i8.p1  ORF type:complete len:320 (+),score=66.43 TRINITY_DN2975_c0_g1_i8:136-1095(+)